MTGRRGGRAGTLALQLAIVAAALAIWEWGWEVRPWVPWLVPDILDPYFVSRPSEIWTRFLRMGCVTAQDGHHNGFLTDEFFSCMRRDQNNLWVATLVTLKNTVAGFCVGVASGVAVGLALGRSDRLAEVFEPFIVAFNSVPRIALVPLIILAFGLGDWRKNIVTSWFVVFFVVFFNTYEGARAVDRDHINAARLLGAGDWTITRTVVVPSTLSWVFSSLSPAISFSLIGVIVGEFIGTERGIGRSIIESEAVGNAGGMMVAIFVLMIVGVLLTFVIRRIQRHLLRWQPRLQS